jgi:hypothetical protein
MTNRPPLEPASHQVLVITRLSSEDYSRLLHICAAEDVDAWRYIAGAVRGAMEVYENLHRVPVITEDMLMVPPPPPPRRARPPRLRKRLV